LSFDVTGLKPLTKTISEFGAIPFNKLKLPVPVPAAIPVTCVPWDSFCISYNSLNIAVEPINCEPYVKPRLDGGVPEELVRSQTLEILKLPLTSLKFGWV